MYRLIMTDEMKHKILEDFTKKLMNYKRTEKFVVNLGNTKIKDGKQAVIVITTTAYKKIKYLVKLCDKEIAWHCTVSKRETDEAVVYTLTDTYVFPQTVTGATVKSDDTEYAEWITAQPDEVFNNLRCHGHSHVNMGVSPSGVDKAYQQDVLDNLNDFYIFNIFNKRGDIWATIFDVEDNIVYEPADIEVVLPDEIMDPEEAWAIQQIDEQVLVESAKKPKTQSKKKEANEGYSTWWAEHEQMMLDYDQCIYRD